MIEKEVIGNMMQGKLSRFSRSENQVSKTSPRVTGLRINNKSNILKPFFLIIIFSFLTLIFAAPFATIAPSTNVNGIFQTNTDIFVNLSTNLTKENYINHKRKHL